MSPQNDPYAHVQQDTESKRIIILLDGTWNDDEIGGNRSNILRLHDLIAECLDPQDTPTSAPITHSPGWRAETSARTFAGHEYIVFYQRGVGTGQFDRLRGGGLGAGLNSNIRRAYRFLSFHYQPGDEILIFGFSRGAYTARSLTGYLGAIGLLRSETCTERERHRLGPSIGHHLMIDCPRLGRSLSPTFTLGTWFALPASVCSTQWARWVSRYRASGDSIARNSNSTM